LSHQPPFNTHKNRWDKALKHKATKCEAPATRAKPKKKHKTPHKMAKKVSFGDLTIHEHPYELGDHPACSTGAPLTIGWTSRSSTTRNLDLYEYMRGERRRGRKQLVLKVTDRAQILLRAGYDISEIAKVTIEIEEIKKNRAESAKGTSMERFGKIIGGMANMALKPKRHTVQARSA